MPGSLRCYSLITACSGGNCCEKFRNVCGKGRIRCQVWPRASLYVPEIFELPHWLTGMSVAENLMLFSRVGDPNAQQLNTQRRDG